MSDYCRSAAEFDQAVRSSFNGPRHETRAIETTPVNATSVGLPFAAQ
jgi:hypothetical protein